MKHEITNEQPFAWFLRVWQGRLINQLERERERERASVTLFRFEWNAVETFLDAFHPLFRQRVSVSRGYSSLSLSLSLVQFNSIVSPVSFHRLDHQRFLFILRLCRKVSSEHPRSYPPRLSGRSMGGKRTGIPSPYAIKRWP